MLGICVPEVKCFAFCQLDVQCFASCQTCTFQVAPFSWDFLDQVLWIGLRLGKLMSFTGMVRQVCRTHCPATWDCTSSFFEKRKETVQNKPHSGVVPTAKRSFLKWYVFFLRCQAPWPRLTWSQVFEHHLVLFFAYLGGRKTKCCKSTQRPSPRTEKEAWDFEKKMVVTWLILPVVICLSQRLSHACLSINNFILWNCEWLIKSVIVYLIIPTTWITVVILELIHAKNLDFWKRCIY